MIGQQRKLRGAGAAGGKPEHPVPDRGVGHTVTKLVDHARQLAPGALWKVAAHPAAAHLPVDRVDADRVDLDPDLASRRVRIGHVDDLQHLRAPELAELNRSHRHAPGWGLLAPRVCPLPTPGSDLPPRGVENRARRR